MKKRIHTICALALTAVLCASCDGKIEPESGEDSGRVIGFSCGDVKSRVHEADAGNMTSFRVSAVWTKAAGNYVSDYMDGQIVSKDGTGAWTYSPIRTMPSYGMVDFFAYSPADAAVSDFAIVGDRHDQVSLTYDVTTDAVKQHDFLISEALEQTKPTILLDFQHMLSSVRVKAKSTEPGYIFRIHEVKLINLFRTGELVGTTSSAPGKTTVWAWRNQKDLATYTIAQAAPVDAAENDYTYVSDLAAGPMMILPQIVSKGNNDKVTQKDIDDGNFPMWMLGLPKDFATKCYVAVTYEMCDSLGNSITGEIVTTYFPLSDPSDPAQPLTLEMGKRYVLSIDLKYVTTRSSGEAGCYINSI